MAMGIADGYSAYASQGRAGAAGNRGTGKVKGKENYLFFSLFSHII